MVVAVVADGMVFGEDALEYIGMEFRVLPRHVESGRHVVLLEDVEDGRRVLVVGAVVKGQVGHAAFAVWGDLRQCRHEALLTPHGERLVVVNGRAGV